MKTFRFNVAFKFFELFSIFGFFPNGLIRPNGAYHDSGYGDDGDGDGVVSGAVGALVRHRRRRSTAFCAAAPAVCNQPVSPYSDRWASGACTEKTNAHKYVCPTRSLT